MLSTFVGIVQEIVIGLLIVTAAMLIVCIAAFVVNTYPLVFIGAVVVFVAYLVGNVVMDTRRERQRREELRRYRGY